MKIKNSTVFIVNPKSTCRTENDNNCTVYNPDTDVISTISPFGKAILDLLDGQTSVAEVYSIIIEIYSEYASEEGKTKFIHFFEELVDRGILQVNNMRLEDELKTAKRN